MTRKTRIIVIIISLTIFVIAATVLIIIQRNKMKTSNSEDENNYYATNDTYATTEESTSYVDENNNIVMSNGVIRKQEYKYDDVLYSNLNLLTDEQYNNKDKMYQLVTNFIKNGDDLDNQAKKVTNATLNDKTNNLYDANVCITLTYDDGTTNDIIVIYDSNYRHEYLRCISEKLYIEIQNGEHAG